MTVKISSWTEIGSTVFDPNLDKIEKIFTTSSSQAGYLDLSGSTDYWSTSGSLYTSFTVPPSIAWDDWLDWAFAQWTTFTKDEVRNSPEEYLGLMLAELAMLSSTSYIGQWTALKLSQNFDNLKNQSMPLPIPEGFTDPVERANWHVFWNLDRCLTFAKESGAIILQTV